MKTIYKSYEDLPLTLSVLEVAAALEYARQARHTPKTHRPATPVGI